MKLDNHLIFVEFLRLISRERLISNEFFPYDNDFSTVERLGVLNEILASHHPLMSPFHQKEMIVQTESKALESETETIQHYHFELLKYLIMIVDKKLLLKMTSGFCDLDGFMEKCCRKLFSLIYKRFCLIQCQFQYLLETVL